MQNSGKVGESQFKQPIVNEYAAPPKENKLGKLLKRLFGRSNSSTSEKITNHAVSQSYKHQASDLIKPDHDVNQAATDSLGNKVLGSSTAEKNVVFKKKDGWFVNLFRRNKTQVTDKTPVRTNVRQTLVNKPKTHVSTNLKKASARDILDSLNSGETIDETKLLAKVKDLHKRFLAAPKKHNLEDATTLHLLEEKVATQFEQLGNLQGSFSLRALAAEIPIAPNHTLANLKEKVAGPPMGTHFSHLDSGVVKGGQIHGVSRKIDGAETHSFHFKVSVPARNKLHTTLDHIKQNKEAFQASLPSNFGQVTFETKPYTFKGKDADGNFSDQKGYTVGASVKSEVVTFEGLGKVILGANSGFACLYNSISIEIDPKVPENNRLQAMHRMVSVLGIGPAFGAQRQEDSERIKIAKLFRAYHPSLAFKMEREASFYDMPTDALMAKMNSLAPDMESKWQQLDAMVEEEIYPGKMAWSVPNISNEMKKQGAFGLMMGVGAYNSKKVSDIVCLILKNGALSSQDRFQSGLFVEGASSSQDLQTGGGDSVFTRCITQQLENQRGNMTYVYQGQAQILFDLDVVNRGAYGYAKDEYGTKDSDVYGERNNLVELAKILTKEDSASMGNEIMIRNRIDPSFIRGVVVQTEQQRDDLLQGLRDEGLVNMKDSIEYVNGKRIDEFVLLAKSFTANMWNTT